MPHIVRNSLGASSLLFDGLAKMALLGLFARGEAAALESPRISVRFEQVGQVCLDTAEAQRLLGTLTEQPVNPDEELTLIAYSDRVEMRAPQWRANATCVKSTVPSFLVAHERIGWLRAMGVIEFLRANQVAGFASEPRLVIGPDSNYRNMPGEKLAIVLQRSSAIGPSERRLDIVRTPSAKSTTAGAESVAIRAATAPTLSDVVAGSLPANGRAQEQRHGRVMRLATLTAGLTGLGLGIGFLAAGASYQQQSLREYSPQARHETLEFAEPFWHAGGWSLGIGAGVTAVGTALFLYQRHSDAALQNSQPRSAADGLRDGMVGPGTGPTP